MQTVLCYKQLKNVKFNAISLHKKPLKIFYDFHDFKSRYSGSEYLLVFSLLYNKVFLFICSRYEIMMLVQQVQSIKPFLTYTKYFLDSVIH